MNAMRIPSLQHLVRNWRDTPEKVERELLHLMKSKPPFSYELLNHAAYDSLWLRVPEDQIALGVSRKEKRSIFRNTILEILPLMCGHFENIKPDFVNQVSPKYYPVGRGLQIPFRPPLLYGIGGQICFPWFIFWRSNPLDDEQFSLFVTLVEEMLLQDPDLEEARFQILDFSARSTKEGRRLRVIEASEVPRISESRKREMLTIFIEGFQRVNNTLRETRPELENSQQEAEIDKNQMPFWDRE